MTDDMEELLNRLGRDYRKIPVPPGLAKAIILNAREHPASSAVPPWVVLAMGVAVAFFAWLTPWRQETVTADLYLPSLSGVVLPPYPRVPGFPSVNIGLSDMGGVPPLPVDANTVNRKPAILYLPVRAG